MLFEEVLLDVDLPAFSLREYQLPRPDGRQLPHDPCGPTLHLGPGAAPCEYPNACYESLERVAHSLWQATGRRKRIRVPLTEECKTKVDERTGLIHRSCRYVNVNEHTIRGGPDRLEKSAP